MKSVLVNCSGRLMFLGIALLVFSWPCFSQKMLALDRSGHAKRIRFEVADEIKVWLKDTTMVGEISHIGDSSIVVGGKTIAIAQIEALRYKSKSFGVALLRQMATKFPIAGGALLLFDVVNGALDPNYSRFTPGILIVSGSLIVVAPVAYLFTIHKYKIGARNQLKVLDLDLR